MITENSNRHNSGVSYYNARTNTFSNRSFLPGPASVAPLREYQVNHKMQITDSFNERNSTARRVNDLCSLNELFGFRSSRETHMHHQSYLHMHRMYKKIKRELTENEFPSPGN